MVGGKLGAVERKTYARQSAFLAGWPATTPAPEARLSLAEQLTVRAPGPERHILRARAAMAAVVYLTVKQGGRHLKEREDYDLDSESEQAEAQG